jgi:hypothetical protein
VSHNASQREISGDDHRDILPMRSRPIHFTGHRPIATAEPRGRSAAKPLTTPTTAR